MEDKENVQSEAVSPEGGDVSPEVKPEVKPEGEPKEQPFTSEQEARMQQLMAEAKETGKREMQGIKDREVAEAQRRARFAEGESASYKSSFSNLDDETRKDLELAQLRSQVPQYQAFMRDEEQRKQAESYRQNLQGSLVEHVKALGIDPDDKRIDWAENETDFLVGRSKFDASMARILKEKQGEAEKKLKDDFKGLESQLRKDLGLDSETPAGIGGGSDSDADFKKGVGDGSIPIKGNKVNYERAKKLGLA